MSENPLDLFDGAKKPDLTLISETPVENTTDVTRERPNAVDPENAVDSEMLRFGA